MTQDSAEQFHEPKQGSWALWIVMCVLILFGGFWLLTERSIRSKQTPDPVPTSPTASLNSLQAAVIESDIPDFSQEF